MNLLRIILASAAGILIASSASAACDPGKPGSELTGEALERKIFGSPFFFVDGEPFWGHDRIAYIDEWLAKGGW